MLRYSIARVLTLIPIILAVSLIVFILVELAPGDIVDAWISGEMTQEDVAALKAQYNLDKPMFQRYVLYMADLVQGDLGMSLANRVPVFGMYMERLPNTLLLVFSSSVLGVAVAIPLGMLAARKAGTVVDAVTTSFSLLGMSMPQFWLGLMLMLLFSLVLGWFPAGDFDMGIRSLVLPAVCSALSLMAMCVRQTRSSMLEVLRSDFLRTARAKGVPERKVIRKHALGNALIPIITTVGTSICVSLAGSAIIEQVYAWPGVGRMLVTGVTFRDSPVVIGCVIMTTILYVIVMLIVDLLYAFIDPRIKSQYTFKYRKSGSGTPPSVPLVPGGEPESAVPEPEYAEATESLLPQVPADVAPDDRKSRASIFMTDDDADGAGDGEGAKHSYAGARDYVTRENKEIVLSNLVEETSGVVEKYKKRSQMGEIWHRLIQNKSSLVGLIILALVIAIAIYSLFMDYTKVNASNMSARFSPPTWQYPFGADHTGRNTFLRVLYGTRYSLLIGFGAVALAAIIGIALGSVAAYYGGMTDSIIMRVSDTLASIPGLLLGMVIMAVMGMSLQNLIIAVGVAGIPPFIRMARASILTVKGNEFVEAARSVGFSDLRIIATQVLPNGLSPLIVQTTTILGLNIVIGAALSFLGFGVPAPTPEWGALVSAGRMYARNAPWLMAFPGIFIVITVLGFNLLGDGLRDALDPKLKK